MGFTKHFLIQNKLISADCLMKFSPSATGKIIPNMPIDDKLFLQNSIMSLWVKE